MLRGYNFLMYNDVLLEVVKLVSHKREAVYDKPKLNYMYTRHTLVVRAILSAKTSEHILGPNRYKPNTSTLTPTAKDGNMAVVKGEVAPHASGLESDNAIRHALMAPRRRLYYVVGSEYVIDAPHGDAPCDATFGPIPLFCHIEKIAGMSTISVLFGIQVDITQCPLFKDGENLPPVAWHEYSQDVSVDDKFLSTRTTKGEIRVRADAVAQGNYPDRFREYFAQSCPAHYKRDSIRIVQHPDMQRLEYVIVDKEQERPIINNGFAPNLQYNVQKPVLDANGIPLKDAFGNVILAPVERTIQLKEALSRVARLKVRHTVSGGRKFDNSLSAVSGNPLEGLLRGMLALNLGPAVGAAINAILAGMAQNVLRGGFDRGNAINEKDEGARTLLNLRYGTPTISEKVEIQVIGNPASTRYELELIAWYILIQRSPFASTQADNKFRDQFFAGGSINFMVSHDVMANDVVMTFEYTRAAPQMAGLGAVLTDDNEILFGPAISGEASIVGREVIPGMTLHSHSSNHDGNPLLNVPASALPPNTHNPWGRNGDYMHGTDLAEARVDSLHEQCEAPHRHDKENTQRGPNEDAVGVVLDRQPMTLSQNLNPPPV